MTQNKMPETVENFKSSVLRDCVLSYTGVHHLLRKGGATFLSLGRARAQRRELNTPSVIHKK